MTSRRRLLGAAALVFAASFPAPGTAQIRGSELGTVSQTLDGTTISVAYSRPVARGRALFGDVVPWDVIWTPGANWATTLETDKDLRLNGVTVPEGDYSVWMIPHERGPWTLTLNPEPRFFHFQKPDSAAGQIHVRVQPEEGPHTETMTWSFPAVNGDAATLRFAWGVTAVPVRVLVQPTKPAVLAADERARYVGEYPLQIMDGIGYPTEATFRVTEENGMLRGRLPFPIHPGDELDFDLVPAGTDRFSPGLYHGTELFNIEQGVSFEFDVKGEAPAVVFRGAEGTAFGQGVRSDRTSH
jgi:hypothetical protein